MNHYPEHIHELIGLVLSGEATAAQKAELQEWRSANPEQEVYFQQMERLLQIPEPLQSSEIDVDAAWKKVAEQLDRPAKPAVVRRMNTSWWRIAAAAIIVLVAGVYWYSGLPRNKMHVAAASKIESATLPDGSKIVLNSGSMLTYQEQNGARKVQLKGEAYFNVVHDAARPFVVKVKGISVTDIGTSFNIRTVSDSGFVEVLVEEGEVQLSGTGFTRNLHAGQGAVYRKGKGLMVFELHHSNVTAYATGKLEFANTPLSEVAVVLEKTFGVSIDVAEPIRNCALTADFSKENLDTILEIVAATLQIEIVRNQQVIELRGHGCI